MKTMITCVVFALSGIAFSSQPVALPQDCECTNCSCEVCIDCPNCCEDCDCK